MTLHRKAGTITAFYADTVFENSVFPQKDAQPQDEGVRGTGVWGQRHQQADAQKGTGVPCLQVYDGTEKTKGNRLVWGEKFFHFG